MKQHKWHKEIKAWADGAEIEVCKTGTWYGTDYPNFHDSVEFRIKPQPKEKKYLYVYRTNKGVEFGLSFIPDGYLSSDMNFVGKIEVQDD